MSEPLGSEDRPRQAERDLVVCGLVGALQVVLSCNTSTQTHQVSAAILAAKQLTASRQRP